MKNKRYAKGIRYMSNLFELNLQPQWCYHKKAADKTRPSHLSAATNISS